jgi:lysophospholipase L1-like esterase
VVVVQPPPRFAYDLRYDISLLWPNTLKEPREIVIGRREKMNQIEAIAITGYEFVRPLVNFSDQFCSTEICDPKINGEFMLEDEDHLSADGSQFLAPQIQEAIRSALDL